MLASVLRPTHSLNGIPSTHKMGGSSIEESKCGHRYDRDALKEARPRPLAATHTTYLGQCTTCGQRSPWLSTCNHYPNPKLRNHQALSYSVLSGPRNSVRAGASSNTHSGSLTQTEAPHMHTHTHTHTHTRTCTQQQQHPTCAAALPGTWYGWYPLRAESLTKSSCTRRLS